MARHGPQTAPRFVNGRRGDFVGIHSRAAAPVRCQAPRLTELAVRARAMATAKAVNNRRTPRVVLRTRLRRLYTWKHTRVSLGRETNETKQEKVCPSKYASRLVYLVRRYRINHSKRLAAPRNNAEGRLVKYQASLILLTVFMDVPVATVRTWHGRTIYYNVKYKYTIRNE